MAKVLMKLNLLETGDIVAVEKGFRNGRTHTESLLGVTSEEV